MNWQNFVRPVASVAAAFTLAGCSDSAIEVEAKREFLKQPIFRLENGKSEQSVSVWVATSDLKTLIDNPEITFEQFKITKNVFGEVAGYYVNGNKPDAVQAGLFSDESSSDAFPITAENFDEFKKIVLGDNLRIPPQPEKLAAQAR